MRINKDGSVKLKIRYQQEIEGTATYKDPVLRINFNEEVTTYTHILLTVNQFSYEEIGHAFGVLSGVHKWNRRSEATIAVLVGPYSMGTKGRRKTRKHNYETDMFVEYEVGRKEFFALDKGDPAKLATFISGHLDRYISPPSTPNEPMLSRRAKYRLLYFKSACYAGLKFVRLMRSSSVEDEKKPILLKKLESQKRDCLSALTESFQHGFCDPVPSTIDNDSDSLKP